MRTWLAALVVLFTLTAYAARAQTADPACEPGVTRVRDGFVWAHRCVSTGDARAQDAFDDGLTLLYAFNPEQARRAFQSAAREDATLAVSTYLIYLDGPHAGHTDYLGHDCAFGIDAFMMSGEAARARALARDCSRDGANFASIIDLRFADWAALALALGRERLRALRAGSDSLSAIESAILEARIARADNAPGVEIAALERAVTIQDGFGYSEPPTFWYPVRESLGGAFARAGRYAEADHTFRAALVHDRDDPRALRARRVARARRPRSRSA